ncbi:MAG: hypothetical protein QOE46_3155 [Acidobacteriota bacterium]|jgi:hypothetical protein|nr:hypothetical protein [Acidobacteriota bacterium]
MLRPAQTVADFLYTAFVSLSCRAAVVDETNDGDGDGAEQKDVYESFLAHDEFSHEPRGEESRCEQPDVQVTPSTS